MFKDAMAQYIHFAHAIGINRQLLREKIPFCFNSERMREGFLRQGFPVVGNNGYAHMRDALSFEFADFSATPV